MATISHLETGIALLGEAPKITFLLHAFDEVDKGRWDRLFRESETCNLFYDYTVVQSAQLTWKKYQSLKVICGYLDDKLIFLQPVLINSSQLAKRIELLSLPTADANEPLVCPDHWENAVKGFLGFVSENLEPDIIVAKWVSNRLYDVLTSHFGSAIIVVKQLRRRPVLHLPSSLEEYWDSFQSKARNQLKRKIKKAQIAGFEFRVVQSGEEILAHDQGSALDNLTRLHQMRFDSINRDSFFVKADFQGFHRSLCKNLHSAPVFFIFLEAVQKDKVVGSIYGMMNDQVYIYLMIGFNPDYASYSIGNLLIYYTIQNLIANRIKLFDFKYGKESYKRWWTKDYNEAYDLSICLNKKGRLLDAASDLLKFTKRIEKLARNPARIPEKIVEIFKAKTNALRRR